MSRFSGPLSPQTAQTMIAITPLRLGAGLTLLYMHAWTQAIEAWQYLWNSKPWEAVPIVEKAGLPLPQVLAVLGTAILVFTAVSWVFGFATRFSSFLFLFVSAIGLMLAKNMDNPYAGEACLLYLIISFTLVFTGPGILSLDTFFTRRKKPKKSSYYH